MESDILIFQLDHSVSLLDGNAECVDVFELLATCFGAFLFGAFAGGLLPAERRIAC